MKITGYRAARIAAWTGGLDIRTDPLAVMLLGDSYHPNVDGHGMGNIEPHEISAGGYKQGGAILLGQKLTSFADKNFLVADPPEWRFDDTVAISYAVIYALGGPPIALIDFDGVLRVPHLKLEWDERGILRI